MGRSCGGEMTKQTTKTPDISDVQLHVAGDMGVLVGFGEQYDPVINNAVMAFDAAFSALALDGVLETVPSFRSLLVRFDPLELAYERLVDVLSNLVARENWFTAPPPKNRKTWILPVVYGADFGPDLDEVADLMGLRADQVIDSHCAQPLTVAMLGFSPGLAYLGQLPEIWQFPRRTEITPKVPAGAILTAVRQTVLPATDIPTGWRQIGQTPFRSFNPDCKTPFLLSPGDSVKFTPVNSSAYTAFDMGQYLQETGR